MASSNLVQLIKQIAVEAVNASKPCDYNIGTVINTNPLCIKMSQSIIVDEDFLHLTQAVTKNPLKKGDKVLMLRKQGGNEYTIIDRLVS